MGQTKYHWRLSNWELRPPAKSGRSRSRLVRHLRSERLANFSSADQSKLETTRAYVEARSSDPGFAQAGRQTGQWAWLNFHAVLGVSPTNVGKTKNSESSGLTRRIHAEGNVRWQQTVAPLE